ncbi:FixH family protein [Extensimonas vulgaris]|uniref:FixH family protein n=1 Tax=Extensimonas vulgaris TaxID=1031594 RepID=UPI000DF1430B|nr:FixH family protein [Extensimonas vulgaris]TXD16493.1 nitrogen fixation protein FixH [Extensimonas vulgaris]
MPVGSKLIIDARPWWRFGYVWLLIAGPVIVIIAGFVTLWLAVHNPDPVIDEDYYQHGLEINRSLADSGRSLAPALKARNHVLTPTKDQPR